MTTEAAGFVSACDGQLSIGQIADALAALLEWNDEEQRSELFARVRALTEGGFLDIDE